MNETNVTLTAEELEAVAKGARHLRSLPMRAGEDSEAMWERLAAHVRAVESLEAERREIGEAITDRYTQADLDGFDKRALRELIRRRRMDREEREQLEAQVHAYEQGLLDLE